MRPGKATAALPGGAGSVAVPPLVGVVAAALFFGLLRACFFALEIEARVPSVTGMALQGLVILVMLVLTQPTAFHKWLGKS